MTGSDVPPRDRLASSFDEGSDRYDRLRPSYPADAARFCVPFEHARVADIGAGTGKFTQVLHELGHEVIAVEPSAAMRGQLSRILPGVQVLDGTAERTGLPGAAVDAVVFAQAWHWADVPRATAELIRVLRPGGTVAMVWNRLDGSVAWLDRVEEQMHSTALAWDRHSTSWAEVGPTSGFSDGEMLRLPWQQTMTKADLADLVTTHSYYLATDPEEQQALRRRVHTQVEQEFPGLSEDAIIQVPYVTICCRYRRLS